MNHFNANKPFKKNHFNDEKKDFNLKAFHFNGQTSKNIHFSGEKAPTIHNLLVSKSLLKYSILVAISFKNNLLVKMINSRDKNLPNISGFNLQKFSLLVGISEKLIKLN